jgi:hypothetical protein
VQFSYFKIKADIKRRGYLNRRHRKGVLTIDSAGNLFGQTGWQPPPGK